MRLIGYARVSTEDQDLSRQIHALQGAGCELIYREKISGGTKKRPELDKMLKDLVQGDCVVIQKLDRLGRSVVHLVRLMEEFQRDKIGFRSLTESFDISTSQGRFQFQIMAAVAELERSMMQERTRDGLRIKKLQGVKLGAPVKTYSGIDFSKSWEASGLSRSGYYKAKKRIECKKD